MTRTRIATVLGAFMALLAPTLRALPPSTGLVVQSWKYDPAQGQLGNVIRGNVVLNLVNLSGKDITAFNVSITETYADGSTDYVDGRPNEPSEHMEEMLGALIIAGLYGEAGQHTEPPNGVIAAGTNRTLMLPQAKDISDVKAAVDVVVYADGTAEVFNERAFTEIVAMRKGSLMVMQAVSKVIHQVLADPTITNPSAAAVEALKRELAEAEKHKNPETAEANEKMGLQNEVANLERIQRPDSLRSVTARDYLKQYAEDMDKRIALTAPHCQIQKLN